MSLVGKNVRVRGRWWHYLFQLNGQTQSGNTGLAGNESNRSAAEEFAERTRQSLLNPGPALVASEDPARKVFMVAAEQFTAWAKNVEYRAKPNTAARLRTSMASCILFFADRPVREIDAAAIENYKEFRMREHQVRDITVRHDLHALSVFFRYALKMKWAQSNPVKEVKIPTDRDAVREHVVSAAEEDGYLATALELHAGYVKTWAQEKQEARLPNMHDLAILMLEQGARPEELLAARAGDVDLTSGTLAILGGKTRSARRLLNLTARSLAIVERRLAAAAARRSLWLFPSEIRPGRHITRLQATHDRICREAGVSFVIYDFRHTFATRAIESGADAPTVAAIMGHSGLRTIYRYVHPTAQHIRETMERVEAAQNRKRLKVVG